jgi:hypothetical protein
MVLSFQYSPVSMTGRNKPVIPVILFKKGNDINNPDRGLGVGMLVDSGADYTTISRGIAESLGLDVESLPDGLTHGVGRRDIPLKSGELTMILQRGGEAYCFDTEIHILSEGDLITPLLGRNFIFERFDITFRERKLRVEFVKKILDDIEKIPPITR